MRFKVTSPFGALEEIRNGNPHTGIDLSMPSGTDVFSPVSGIVEKIVNYGNENIGKGIIIRTEDGEQLIFGHLSEWKVKVGEHIDKGELIALSGDTGNSTAAHLHVGLKENGRFIDPQQYAEVIQGNDWFSQIKEFLFQDSIFTHWIVELGFNIVQSEVFFLIPAVLFFGIRLLMGKNITSKWIIPLLYGYFVTEHF